MEGLKKRFCSGNKPVQLFIFIITLYEIEDYS